MTRQIKRMYRSGDESRLAGVCSGIGLYFGIDPVVVRLSWVLVTIFTGVLPGILAYLLAWMIVPERPLPTRVEPASPPKDRPSEHPA